MLKFGVIEFNGGPRAFEEIFSGILNWNLLFIRHWFEKISSWFYKSHIVYGVFVRFICDFRVQSFLIIHFIVNWQHAIYIFAFTELFSFVLKGLHAGRSLVCQKSARKGTPTSSYWETSCETKYKSRQSRKCEKKWNSFRFQATRSEEHRKNSTRARKLHWRAQNKLFQS